MSFKTPFTSISIAAIIIASVIFGMILAGVLDLGSNGIAEPAPQQALELPTGEVSNFVDVAEVASPAIVAITSTKITKSRHHSSMDPDTFRWFFGPQGDLNNRGEEEEKVQAGGSGFLISSDGYIITNNHVIEEADLVEVTLNEEGAERIKAEVVGTDPATDLALLKISTDRDLPYLLLGDAETLKVGEWVMAAGYPLRYGYTVTVGVVSAKGKRLGLTDVSFENFIQTDAAINFGNSGGPLLNSQGKVIGINTAIAARGQNIGFAVPIEQFKRIEKQLKKNGKVIRGYLGVKIENIDSKIQDAFKLSSRKGAFVEQVLPDTPADKSGLKHGDVIVKVDGIEIDRTDELISYVSSQEPGTTVRLSILRNGKSKELKAKLTERTGNGSLEEPEKDDSDGVSVKEKLGLTVRELTPELSRYYRLNEDIEGLLVTHVKRVSPAADEGLKQGDIILEVNGKTAKRVEDLEAVVSESENNDLIRLYMMRPGRQSVSFFAIIRVDE